LNSKGEEGATERNRAACVSFCTRRTVFIQFKNYNAGSIIRRVQKITKSDN